MKKKRLLNRHFGFGPRQRKPKRGHKSLSPWRLSPVTLEPSRYRSVYGQD